MDTFLKVRIFILKRGVSDEKKRRKFSKDFKEEAMKLILEQGHSIYEAARNIGVNANLL